MPDRKPVDAASLRHGHEIHDLSVKGVLLAGGGLLLGLVLIGAGVLAGIDLAKDRLWEGRPPVSLVDRGEVVPPPPRLQENPQAHAAVARATADARLASYGWIDRSAGIARIPIEEAMRLVAERGWPAEAAP